MLPSTTALTPSTTDLSVIAPPSQSPQSILSVARVMGLAIAGYLCVHDHARRGSGFEASFESTPDFSGHGPPKPLHALLPVSDEFLSHVSVPTTLRALYAPTTAPSALLTRVFQRAVGAASKLTRYGRVPSLDWRSTTFVPVDTIISAASFDMCDSSLPVVRIRPRWIVIIFFRAIRS